MRKVIPKELTLEAFDAFGRFSDAVDPKGPSVGPEIHEFFRDALVFNTASPYPVSLSVSRVLDRPHVIATTEIHPTSGELILPLNGDVYCHVGLPSGPDEPDFNTFEVFRIPAGTAVMLNNGVWHYATFPCGTDPVSVLILLPERTYAYDCVVVDIPQEDQIQF